MTVENLSKGPLAWAALLFVSAIIIGVFIWDISSDQTEQRIRGEQNTQNHIEYAEDRIEDRCLDLEGVVLRDCIQGEIKSALDQNRANKNLTAQQEMAFFTKIMGFTAVFGLVLGGVSIFVVFATLREMSRTNQIMRQEQRPWLKFEFEEFGEFQAVGWENGEKSLVFFPVVKIENSGKSPALDVWFDVRIWEGKSFNGDGAREEMFSDFLASSNRPGPIALPGEPIIWEGWGAGHIVRKQGVSSNRDNATNNFWFVAMLAYRFGEQWFYTSQMFSCKAVEMPVGNNKHMLKPYHLSWNDIYK